MCALAHDPVKLRTLLCSDNKTFLALKIRIGEKSKKNQMHRLIYYVG
jgi:hypothetical protein